MNDALLATQHAVWAKVGGVATSHERTVAGNVFGIAKAMGRSCIDIFAITDADQVGNLGGEVGAAIESRELGIRLTQVAPICCGLRFIVFEVG